MAYYEASMRTKWHDTDANRIVRPSQILMYMQETANMQCDEYGYELDRLRDTDGCAFLLSSISMNFYAPLHAFEDIRVRTWCPETHGASYLRCFSILRGEDVVAEASSVWALLRLYDRTFVKAPEFRATHDFPDGEPIPADRLLRKPRISPSVQMTDIGARRIVYSDIDYNMHMNNTRYPDMLCDFIPDVSGKRVSAMSLSYLREASYGSEIRILYQAHDGSHWFRTKNPDGQTALEAEVRLTYCE